MVFVPVARRLPSLVGAAAAAAALVLLVLLPGPSPAAAGGGSSPFSSNVVALTERNWRREVLESPHAVFVNICRSGWGYCQMLQPEWERLAGAVKGNVKVAYWDTEQRGGRPALLGEIKGTPTIRLYRPVPKQGPSNAKKVVVDYNFERKAKDMKRFADANMPDFIEKVRSAEDLDKFEAKAGRNGLPRVLLFTEKTSTSPLTKYLSTEFRRRLLLAEVRTSKPETKGVAEKYGVTSFPALVVVPPAGSDGGEEEAPEPVMYEGEGFTKNKLQTFLSKHALKDPVMPKKKEKKEDADGEKAKDEEEPSQPRKESVKTEL